MALPGLLLLAPAARAELSSEELAKLAQNPVGNLVSVPFQNNTNFDFGPLEKDQNVLNIQPVYPIHLNPDWNVITRTILPLLWQPALAPGAGSTFGLSDIQFSAFLSPANPGGFIWGVGGIAQLPTHTDDRLGNDRWGLGPTAVILRMSRGSPWVYGALINNLWSVNDSNSSPPINQMLLQPFLNYNFPGGTYLTTAPIITANWQADSGDTWTVPLGGGVGHIFHVGKLPVNSQIAAYYNVETPEYGADWQLRVQVQFMFPK
ncbi:MAG: neuromedin U [Gammaproteobacteria bacterium]|nr:neuromedin U [Gammaproteobacteria bacterium]